METSLVSSFDEACLPITLIWERINHAYTSDSPPTHWGLQKGDYGFQSWIFCSHNENYTVVWDNRRSYWKVSFPFGIILYFIGPLFMDGTSEGLPVPPFFTVKNSDTDTLMPASSKNVEAKMLNIAKHVANIKVSQIPKPSTSQN